jgi:hypothetical protein
VIDWSSIGESPGLNEEGKLMRVSHSGSLGTISRGTFIRGVAGGLALAAVGEPVTRFRASAAELEDEGGKILPAPRPIPGGDVIPPQIHVFEPGTPGKHLPYTGAPLEGLNVEPSTITDFKGFIAQAYHVGTATGNDGKRYSLETDVRAYQGEYVAVDGSHQRGTFALL